MRLLAIDTETTGLQDRDRIIEIGMVPFDTTTRTVEKEMAFQLYLACPSFEELKPNLDPWIIENMKGVIDRAHTQGISHRLVAEGIREYMKCRKDYFHGKPPMLFGKSLTGVDQPFMEKTFGREKFMRELFSYRSLDMTSVAITLVDLGLIPGDCMSHTKLMKLLVTDQREWDHTALQDCYDTIEMYFKALDMIKGNFASEMA